MLLLDEPSMGLAPLLVSQVAQTIRELNAEGVTVLLVEQMATMALTVADRAYVIQNGRGGWRARARRSRDDPEVVRAYLGGASSREDLTNTGSGGAGNGVLTPFPRGPRNMRSLSVLVAGLFVGRRPSGVGRG